MGDTLVWLVLGEGGKNRSGLILDKGDILVWLVGMMLDMGDTLFWLVDMMLYMSDTLF